MRYRCLFPQGDCLLPEKGMQFFRPGKHLLDIVYLFFPGFREEIGPQIGRLERFCLFDYQLLPGIEAGPSHSKGECQQKAGRPSVAAIAA